MCPEDLDKQIKCELDKGNKPFMVCSTAGTTVEGAIDRVEEIGKVCKKYGIWLHLDAAYGGVFFASP
jgi:glutamate/tyrosine decarboxylase-like PLP-dependent enzyme